MAVPKSLLTSIFDEVIRDVTRREVGIRLTVQESVPEKELCTVFANFEQGYRTSLSLCAEEALFRRLAQNTLETEDISPQDVEDFAKEYFNVLCGHIVSRLYEVTKIPARFGIPAFYNGRYVPADHLEHIVLTYSSDEDVNVQLVHHAPYTLREDPLYKGKECAL